MATIGLSHYLVVSAALFSLGVLGVLTRRNAVNVLMGIELILNSANLNLVAFSRYGSGGMAGQLFAVLRDRHRSRRGGGGPGHRAHPLSAEAHLPPRRSRHPERLSMEEIVRSLERFGPELILTAALLLVVVVDATGLSARNGLNKLLAVLGLLAALFACPALARPGLEGSIFSGMLHVDPMVVFFKVLLVGSALLLLLSFTFENSKELHGLGQGEFYALLLALTLSNLLLAASNDIVMMYLALEMVSITSYVLVAYMKGDRMSNEASLKYVLFGAISTGAMLYGLSLLFATGPPASRRSRRRSPPASPTRTASRPT